ncbi:uncharacterized protein CLUP02_03077 [Colletotrichum lupini]|uniref:Uncharacterized protein n=1 Tax=Colletotrichum lupini TaxID=145971 RepID=A0A9Q8SI70_9PEZI|nr:uncharacterized protein CLUP02_03077 [Colletotrichum lupini]UQC77608.1 hypothetical protein CLUP02_03077 [Colletotrichum lupini]
MVRDVAREQRPGQEHQVPALLQKVGKTSRNSKTPGGRKKMRDDEATTGPSASPICRISHDFVREVDLLGGRVRFFSTEKKDTTPYVSMEYETSKCHCIRTPKTRLTAPLLVQIMCKDPGHRLKMGATVRSSKLAHLPGTSGAQESPLTRPHSFFVSSRTGNASHLLRGRIMNWRSPEKKHLCDGVPHFPLGPDVGCLNPDYWHRPAGVGPGADRAAPVRLTSSCRHHEPITSVRGHRILPVSSLTVGLSIGPESIRKAVSIRATRRATSRPTPYMDTQDMDHEIVHIKPDSAF